MSSPSAPPISPSSTLSVSSCRTRRCQPAPSAVRIATSFCRPVARVSSRLATLAQAMSSTSATEPSSTSTARRTSPTTCFGSGTTLIVNVRSRLSLSRMRRGDHAHVGLRLLHRHARLEARHQVVVLVAAAVDRVRAERQWEKDVHLPDAGDGRHHLVVQQEVRPEHADDRELVLGALSGAVADAVQRDAPADDTGIGIEQPLPEARDSG